MVKLRLMVCGISLLMLDSGFACRSGSEESGEAARFKYLEKATSAGRWLQAQANPSRQGAIPVEIGREFEFSASLGTGAAGRIVFFLELFGATGDSTFLASAEKEAEAAIEETNSVDFTSGLYNGASGVGFALTELAKRSTRAGHYRRAGETLFDRIVTGADRRDGSLRWGYANDVLTGTAGIGLALLYAGREYGRPDLMDAASAAGRTLLAAADTVESGLRWRRSVDRDLDLPNFSHGTAGVAFYLTTLGEATGDDTFLAAARLGADYLMAVSDTSDGLFLVPYGIPNEGYVTQYDIGWAHGPAGTSRLFYKLWMLTGDVRYRDVVDACAKSIVASGMPAASSDTLRWTGPFGVDRRFGLSGVVPFLVDWSRISGHPEYLAAARASADFILDRATLSDQGLHWTIPRFAFQGEGDASFTGYFYGSAGMGMALLEIHYADNGPRPRIRFPDDPW